MPRGERSDSRLGAAVMLCIAAVVVGVIVMPRITAPATFEMQVEIPIEEGAAGISPGATVTLGGIIVGTVNRIDLDAKGDGTDFVKVVLRLPQGTRIPTGSTAHLAADALGGNGRIEIVPPSRHGDVPDAQSTADGTPEGAASGAPADGQAAGGQQPGTGEGVVSIAYVKPSSGLESAFGRRNVHRVRDAVSRLEQTDFAALKSDLTARVDAIKADATALGSEIGASADAWRPQWDAMVASIDSAKLRLESIEASLGAGGSLDRERLRATLDRILADWSAIRTDMSALESAWAEEIKPPLSDLLSRAVRAWDILKADAQRMLAAVQESREAAGLASADLQLAGGQLSRTKTEVMFTPWNLLGGIFQGDRAVETRDLSARMVVESATELRIAADATRQLLEADPRLAERYPGIASLLEEWLRSASTRAEAVEAGVFRIMMDEPPPPSVPQAPAVAP